MSYREEGHACARDPNTCVPMCEADVRARWPQRAACVPMHVCVPECATICRSVYVCKRYGIHVCSSGCTQAQPSRVGRVCPISGNAVPYINDSASAMTRSGATGRYFPGSIKHAELSDTAKLMEAPKPMSPRRRRRLPPGKWQRGAGASRKRAPPDLPMKRTRSHRKRDSGAGASPGGGGSGSAEAARAAMQRAAVAKFGKTWLESHALIAARVRTLLYTCKARVALRDRATDMARRAMIRARDGYVQYCRGVRMPVNTRILDAVLVEARLAHPIPPALEVDEARVEQYSARVVETWRTAVRSGYVALHSANLTENIFFLGVMYGLRNGVDDGFGVVGRQLVAPDPYLAPLLPRAPDLASFSYQESDLAPASKLLSDLVRHTAHDGSAALVAALRVQRRGELCE